MIITIAGTVTHKTDRYLVIEAAGIGYQVQMSRSSLAAVLVGSETRFWTHEHLREDARELYGFLTAGDHDLFLKLIGVTGVGPKAAISILELGGAAAVSGAVERSDIGFLSGANGIGRKTAQKIVLELQGRLVSATVGNEGEEVIAALVGLGYGREAAKEALGRIGSDGSVEERLRAALRELGR
jgi:Holliday junction DNA helicase RuvA